MYYTLYKNVKCNKNLYGVESLVWLVKNIDNIRK